MRRLAHLALTLLAAVATPCAAQTVVYEVVEEYEVSDAGSDRFVAAAPVQVPHGVARFGPFRVLDGKRAALVDVTNERSPAAFSAMLAAYPGISALEMLECPGTDDDRANLRLGRMIHARGLVTHVPKGGSVRSGAVELFLAGRRRTADSGAEFAVHSWADNEGHEPRDFAMTAPENRYYLDYYHEMGMSPVEARAFYDMTNSVPNASAKWLNAAQMSQWVRLNQGEAKTGESLDSRLALR
ncbi:MAG: alpha/beta hydrolase [Novosphingobium sp.]